MNWNKLKSDLKKFVSTESEKFLKSCGIKHIRVSPYFARSNGKLERLHRYLKKNVRTAILEGKSWSVELPKICLMGPLLIQLVEDLRPCCSLTKFAWRYHMLSWIRTANLTKSFALSVKNIKRKWKIITMPNIMQLHIISISAMLYFVQTMCNFIRLCMCSLKPRAETHLTLVNVATGTTLIWNAKYLKHA